jgi:hypothetical protein
VKWENGWTRGSLACIKIVYHHYPGRDEESLKKSHDIADIPGIYRLSLMRDTAQEMAENKQMSLHV